MSVREYNFANDLMHFITKKYNLVWSPPVEGHDSSPFKEPIGIGVNDYLLSQEITILNEFHLNIQGCITDQVAFREFATNYFISTDINLGREKEIFHACIYVARVASLLFQNGVPEAPFHAVEAITEALHLYYELYDVDIFQHFSSFSLNTFT